MRLLTQTHQNNPKALQRFGCRAMCLLAIPQVEVQKALDQPTILEILKRGQDAALVFQNPDTYMTGARENFLINEAFIALKEEMVGLQVGEIRMGKAYLWNGRETDDFQYQILHWGTTGADGHFTLADRYGAEIYDPHDPKEAGYEIKKREVVRRLIYRVWRKK